LKKRLIEYIRDREDCNYADVMDVLRDLHHHSYQDAFNVLANILLYVEHHDNIAHGDDMEAIHRAKFAAMLEEVE